MSTVLAEIVWPPLGPAVATASPSKFSSQALRGNERAKTNVRDKTRHCYPPTSIRTVGPPT